MALVVGLHFGTAAELRGSDRALPRFPGRKPTMRLGLYHIYEDSTVVRRAAWRGTLKESVYRTCQHLAMAEKACLKRVPRVKGEYAPRIDEILCVE